MSHREIFIYYQCGWNTQHRLTSLIATAIFIKKTKQNKIENPHHSKDNKFFSGGHAQDLALASPENYKETDGTCTLNKYVL